MHKFVCVGWGDACACMCMCACSCAYLYVYVHIQKIGYICVTERKGTSSSGDNTRIINSGVFTSWWWIQKPFILICYLKFFYSSFSSCSFKKKIVLILFIKPFFKASLPSHCILCEILVVFYVSIYCISFFFLSRE